jgi:WD40 repeat protein/TPR repeat protein
LQRPRLRIFVSSPGDVKAAREIAALTIERLAQDYARYFRVEPYLWEYEAMIASGHFQDSIEPPSAFEIVVLILWSRLGTALPERTAVREYRGIDGRTPVTGTEWEFEEALQSARATGAPDLLVYRNLAPAAFDLREPQRRAVQLRQLEALDAFWARHFVDQGVFLGAYTTFTSDAEYATRLEHHLRRLIEARIAARGAPPGELARNTWTQAPFRGLEAYEFEQAPIFFGQDEALAKAMLQLTGNAEAGSPFLLVLGASGSGKSSLVKAGIVPKLFVPRRIAATAFLRRLVFRPSDTRADEDLFDALARRLTTGLGEHEGLPELIGPGQTAASLAAHLRLASAAPAYPIGTALGQLTARARQSGRMLDYETAKLVLVVDQLEELYTSERVQLEERRRFVDLLSGLVHSGLVWVIATMRKDFWHRADDTPELIRLAEGRGRIELLPPTPAQLSQIVRRPAEAAAIGFELHPTTSVALNEVITEEVAREPGALPLLSYLLDQLYRIDVLEGHGNTLSYATYERLGRLEGAIATQAEAVLARCAAEDRGALGSVLFALVEISAAEGNIDRAVARRVPLSTFPPGSPQRRLVDALLDPDARLLVSDSGSGGTPTVRVAHEALISRWAQAREFVEKNAEALKIRHRIEERFKLWRALGQGGRGASGDGSGPAPRAAGLAGRLSRAERDAGLLTDIDLADGRRLVAEHRADTEPHLVDYIERSIASDLRARARALRRVTAVAVAVTVLAIVASVAGVVALQRQHEAEQQAAATRAAQSRLLTEAAAQRLRDADLPNAQGIILEVLTDPGFARGATPAAISTFEEARAADVELAVLAGHTDIVLNAAYAPDGARIVTASTDRTARIWDARTGLELARLTGHRDILLSAHFSPDGTRIVTASRDRSVRIWDAGSGRELAVLAGTDKGFTSADYSPDGTRIVASGGDGGVRIWDARTGAPLLALVGHVDVVQSAAYSPDGARIVTASHDKTARIWDARSGRALRTLAGHGDVVLTAAFSPDGTRIVTASRDKTARVWDAATGVQLAVLGGHREDVACAAYSPDGTRIVTASFDRTIRVWDARSFTVLSIVTGHADAILSAAYSPDGSRIATASFDKTARIWRARASTPQLLLAHGGPLFAAGYSRDGSRIVTAANDRTARIWDARTGSPLAVLKAHAERVTSAAFSPDGARVVTASLDGSAITWDAVSGAPLRVLSGHRSAVQSASYSPDGTRIVTASDDKTVRVWDAASGTALAVLTGHEDGVHCARYSPDGSRIVSASFDKTARIWDARSGAQVAVLVGHGDSVLAAMYSADGGRIVTASTDGTVRTWDARSGGPLAVLSGHTDSASSAAFSPDGAHIVTASDDRTARIWDARSGIQLAVLVGHTDGVNDAAYSPDGAHVVTASNDGVARVFDAAVPASSAAQIAWQAAAQTEPLAEVDRVRYGLPVDAALRRWAEPASDCDRAAAAVYDPDRRARGVADSGIDADVADGACAAEGAKPTHAPRTDYQWGRARLAKQDRAGALQHFERAAAQGYRAAKVDLARLLADPGGGRGDPTRAIALLEAAWRDGVPVAAFWLGQLHESGIRAPGAAATAVPADRAVAWGWYQRGADAGEPNSLARFAERDNRAALGAADARQRDQLLLRAFAAYATAAARARDDGWPEEAWRYWRYRRASLARVLAGEGMMQAVADAYGAVGATSTRTSPSALAALRQKLGW